MIFNTWDFKQYQYRYSVPSICISEHVRRLSVRVAQERKESVSILQSPRLKSQQEKKPDWTIVKTLLKYMWPKDDKNSRIRVVAALVFLVCGKVLNIQVPFFFKKIVDSMSTNLAIDSNALEVCGALLIGCKKNN